jgi:hypothetical protein
MLGFVARVFYNRQTRLVDIRIGIPCCTVLFYERDDEESLLPD